MRNTMTRTIRPETLILALTFFYSFPANAQDVEMADQMRSSGKIYVVVAVLLLIFLGLILYLIRMDRKITKLEQNQRDKSR